jgi:hypothetical protein
MEQRACKQQQDAFQSKAGIKGSADGAGTAQPCISYIYDYLIYP